MTLHVTWPHPTPTDATTTRRPPSRVQGATACVTAPPRKFGKWGGCCPAREYTIPLPHPWLEPEVRATTLPIKSMTRTIIQVQQVGASQGHRMFL